MYTYAYIAQVPTTGGTLEMFKLNALSPWSPNLLYSWFII